VFQKIIKIIYTKLRKRKVKEKKIEKKRGKNKILRKFGTEGFDPE
jgi:hypothetical protein